MTRRRRMKHLNMPVTYVFSRAQERFRLPFDSIAHALSRPGGLLTMRDLQLPYRTTSTRL